MIVVNEIHNFEEIPPQVQHFTVSGSTRKPITYASGCFFGDKQLSLNVLKRFVLDYHTSRKRFSLLAVISTIAAVISAAVTLLSYLDIHPSPTLLEDPKAVDLGLSVKWANCNMGASSPEEYGSYFAWGETRSKSEYTWDNYMFRVSGSSFDKVTFSKYNTERKRGTIDNRTRLDLLDDVARSNWGGSWRLPTREEMDELRTNCTWTWTTQEGTNGYKVTSKTNGNSIFLPAAGHQNGESLYRAGSYGYYWSSSLNSDDPYLAGYLLFYSGFAGWYHGRRYYGFSVRPVSE